MVVGAQILGRSPFGLPGLLDMKAGRHTGHDPLRYLVLGRKYIRDIAVVTLGPQMVARRRLDQLRGDPDPAAGAADTALDHIVHVEVAADLLNLGRLALVDEGGVARDDEQRAEP